MSTAEVQGNDAGTLADVAYVDLKLEAVVIPVSDVDRAKEFYGNLGWPEPVKLGETTSYADSMSASVLGSLIQATVGSLGGWGRRWRNLAGFAL